MKKILSLLLMVGAATPLMAQTAEEVASSEGSSAVTVILVGILMILGSLAMLAHMIYENFIRKSQRTDYTVEGFLQARQEAGQPEEMTDEELEQLANRLDQINDIWGEVPADEDDEEGDPVPYPMTKSGVKQAEIILAEAVATNPTNERIVEKINACGELINIATERCFNGSKAIVITSIIVAVVVSLLAGSASFAIYIGCSLAVYWLASRTSRFVLVRKELSGVNTGKSFLSGIIGGLFAGVAAAKTYKVVTTYSDGSKTTETDNSETWISLIFALIVIVVLVVCLWFFSLINYLRNYIFYR